VRCPLAAFVLACAAAAAAAQPAADGVLVRFELNDALVKGRVLPGVSVRVERPGGGGAMSAGQTGADGRWTTRLAPGSYEVSYRLGGYVPYTSEATEIREEGQLVTVSLSPIVEATEATASDVRIILNWGSRSDQVRDADSHLTCACADSTRHVFYRNRKHDGAGHAVELDVDDTDWGGPETITLTQPVTGTYTYWVHDYSGPPALLGASDLVVRVLIGGQPAGEFRVFKGLTRRDWRPFKAIRVTGAGGPALVRWTEDELAEGQDLAVPVEQEPPGVQAPIGAVLACPAVILVIGLLIFVRQRRKARRA
jgi:Carboxypeptidase regulatory-like domain